MNRDTTAGGFFWSCALLFHSYLFIYKTEKSLPSSVFPKKWCQRQPINQWQKIYVSKQQRSNKSLFGESKRPQNNPPERFTLRHGVSRFIISGWNNDLNKLSGKKPPRAFGSILTMRLHTADQWRCWRGEPSQTRRARRQQLRSLLIHQFSQAAQWKLFVLTNCDRNLSIISMWANYASQMLIKLY